MRSLGLRALLVGLALVVSACDNSTTDTSTTTPAPTITETFPGTIPAPIGGTAQSAVINFNSAGAGTGTVALTSATETLSNGSLNLGVSVGLQLGVPSGASCTLPSGSTPLFVQAGPTSISAPFVAGANCLLLTSGDQGPTAGPVSFTIVVVHF